MRKAPISANLLFDDHPAMRIAMVEIEPTATK